MKKLPFPEQLHIDKHDFNNEFRNNLSENPWITGLWPLVYILSDGNKKKAYVGETTDGLTRMTNHLKNDTKNKLKHVHLIASGRFNKSATLDIESNLIKYLHGDGIYNLLNGNLGLTDRSYYEKEPVYLNMFKLIWEELRKKGIAKKTLKQIDNSNLFKYSPYKVLGDEQKASVKRILVELLNEKNKSIIVEGGAGTGKSIIAVFLFKLINTDINDFDFKIFDSEEQEFRDLFMELKTTFRDLKMGLVIPMSSFRNTIKKVFKSINGLNSNMVIGPAEVANEKYDILIVDEGHRLRRRKNLGAYFGTFDKVSKKLNFDKNEKSELDWILKQSKNQIIFYDENQSIKPSDVKKIDFERLKKGSVVLALKSQFRVKGGADYIEYVDHLLNCTFKNKKTTFNSRKYEFVLFQSMKKMQIALNKNEKQFGLCRLVAGYSWKWKSKNKNTHDIMIDGVKLKWNGVSSDWVNSKNAIKEVGCIHTTQGYDLNYAGIIFGEEISYDEETNKITIRKENYYDLNGKNAIDDPDELKNYIVNIYKTMMFRGIRGTFVYACDEKLRMYFKKHISTFVE